MTTLEKFNRTIIEALHGKSYEEVIICTECGVEKPRDYDNARCIKNGCCGSFSFDRSSTTLSQVMKALKNNEDKIDGFYGYCNGRIKIFIVEYEGVGVTSLHQKHICEWKLTKPDGYTTATSEDQDEKTLKEILKLFK
jgi:hypothetical protein